jgi:deoxyribodipyrimidine photo-lyase
MKNSGAALVLFDCDFRIEDNEAFFHAAKSGKEILPLFILDEKNKRPLGGALKWFLHHVLENFSAVLKEKYGANLLVKKGDSLKILSEIFSSNEIAKIYFNRSIEPEKIRLHDQIKKLSATKLIEVFEFNSQTIFDPNEIKNGSGTYFKVFTPFWKFCLKNHKLVSKPLSAPTSVINASHHFKNDDLDLLPQKNWADGFKNIWEFDRKKILKNFENFLEKKVTSYNENRNLPAVEGTSKISAYLHFGVISAREIFWLVNSYENTNGTTSGSIQFLNEIGWREFCHHLLFHFPNLPQKNFRPEFDNFEWQSNQKLFDAWKKGRTGFPIVDAGMRELWQTGFMHNRVRMIVGSFLIKDLLIDWREGEKWFWDCLVDADLANNSANWQWVAGSGADAAPYFRIFNPSLQSEKFDSEGKYIRKWVPELAKLPNRYLHAPWEADEKTLRYCEIEFGKTYPSPIVDHAKARDIALMLYKMLK